MRREFASAFAMAFGMLFVPVQKKALSFVTSKVVSVDAAETLERTRGNEIFVALLFVNLHFISARCLEDSRKGAVITQPFTCCDFLWDDFVRGSVRWRDGRCFRPRDCIYVLLRAPFTRGRKYTTSWVANYCHRITNRSHRQRSGGAFLNFLAFDFALKTMPKGVQPVFGAFFYCFVITVEKCKYSCGYMNLR